MQTGRCVRLTAGFGTLFVPLPVQTKRRTHVEDNKADEKNVPRTFVLRRGKTDSSVIELVENMRRVMSPYTALKLKERKCVVVASPSRSTPGVSPVLCVHKICHVPGRTR